MKKKAKTRPVFPRYKSSVIYESGNYVYVELSSGQEVYVPRNELKNYWLKPNCVKVRN